MVVGDVSVRRFAVLIDAENAQLWAIAPLFKEITRYGNARVRRAYGDWTMDALKNWKQTLLDHAIRPVQVFAAVKGKNASDMALVIDAMDLIHSGDIDGFFLISSDSDFSRLAERIREAGLIVHGYGEQKKTNPALVAACDTFAFVDSFASPPAAPAKPPPAPAAKTSPAASAAAPTKQKKAKGSGAAPPPRWTVSQLRADTVLIGRLREAVATNADPDGWTHLAKIGQAIRKHPTIVLRPYGYSRLKDLMVTTALFDLQQRGPGKSGAVHVRVK